MSDEKGHWLRGDIADILCAKYLEADFGQCCRSAADTAVEKCGWFRQVRRTKIGSPFVVASMLQARARGAKCVVGYEANGGFLLNTDIESGGKHAAGHLPSARCRHRHPAGILLLSQESRWKKSRN